MAQKKLSKEKRAIQPFRRVIDQEICNFCRLLSKLLCQKSIKDLGIYTTISISYAYSNKLYNRSIFSNIQESNIILCVVKKKKPPQPT